MYKQTFLRGITISNLLALFRLLTQIIEAPKKRNRTVKSDKHIKRNVKMTIASKIEIKAAVPYVVQV